MKNIIKAMGIVAALVTAPINAQASDDLLKFMGVVFVLDKMQQQRAPTTVTQTITYYQEPTVTYYQQPSATIIYRQGDRLSEYERKEYLHFKRLERQQHDLRIFGEKRRRKEFDCEYFGICQ